MGIYIDHVLGAECEEKELRRRLERVRERCLDLPLRGVGEAMGLAIGNLREEGAPIQVLEDNASKALLVDFSAALKREEEAKPE